MKPQERHVELYKEMHKSGRQLNKRDEAQQSRRRSRRYDNFNQRRRISVSPSEARQVAKALDVPQTHDRAISKIEKLKAIRARRLRAEEARRPITLSPFISTVPTGRIIPRSKPGVLEKKMDEFYTHFTQRSGIKKINSPRAAVVKQARRSINRNQAPMPKKQARKTVGTPRMVRTRAATARLAAETMTNEDANQLAMPPDSGMETGDDLLEKVAEASLKEEVKEGNIGEFLAPPVFNKTTTKKAAKGNLAPFQIEDKSFLCSTVDKRKSQTGRRKTLIPAADDNDTFMIGIRPIDLSPVAKEESPVARKATSPASVPLPPDNDTLNTTFTTPDTEPGPFEFEFVKIVATPAVNTVAEKFYKLLDDETSRLREKITQWTVYKEENRNRLSEQALGMIDMAIGQAELLLKKKFMKFRELIDHHRDGSGEQKVHGDDLEGYWHITSFEVADIDKRFEALIKWMDNGWVDPEETTQAPVQKPKKATGAKKKPFNVKSMMASVIQNAREAKKRKAQEEKEQEELVVAEEQENQVCTPSSRQSQRLAVTPRSERRRSLNCSGCTPSRKSAKKINFAEKTSGRFKRFKSRLTLASTPMPSSSLAEDVLQDEPKSTPPKSKKLKKAKGKKANKSVLFIDPEPETPSPSTVTKRKPRKINKTPRPSRVLPASDSEENFDENNQAHEQAPIEVKSTGRMPLRKSVALKSIENERDTPKTMLDPKSRRSTRLFQTPIDV